MIWGVGGKDNFDYAISEVIELNQQQKKGNEFTKIVLLHDRDDVISDQQIIDKFIQTFESKGWSVRLENGHWVRFIYQNAFTQEIQIEILCLIIPFDQYNDLLESLPWENYLTVQRAFEKLQKI